MTRYLCIIGLILLATLNIRAAESQTKVQGLIAAQITSKEASIDRLNSFYKCVSMLPAESGTELYSKKMALLKSTLDVIGHQITDLATLVDQISHS